MNVEALEQVIRVLDNVETQDKPFDLQHWVSPIYEDREIREKGWFRERVRIERHQCGTAGCAIGWAAVDPWFVEHGFHLQLRASDQYVRPVFGNHENWGAVAKFFGLSKKEAHLLFDEPSYIGKVTPTEVAIRIKAFIGARVKAEAAAKTRGVETVE
jgi:hypothetical protein